MTFDCFQLTLMKVVSITSKCSSYQLWAEYCQVPVVEFKLLKAIWKLSIFSCGLMIVQLPTENYLISASVTGRTYDFSHGTYDHLDYQLPSENCQVPIMGLMIVQLSTKICQLLVVGLMIILLPLIVFLIAICQLTTIILIYS